MNATSFRRCCRLVVVGLSVLAVVLVPAAGARAGDEAFVIVVVPDTQNYVQSEAGALVFREQMSWAVSQSLARNIVFVSHEGDAAQNPASASEWDRVDDAFAVLDAAGMPYAIAPGNHDIDNEGNAPEYDARFGVDRFDDQLWFGGSHTAEGNRSSFQTIEVDGHHLLFVHVRHLQERFGPIGPVLAWLNDVLTAHPDHLTFVTTHEFTNAAGEVTVPALETTVAAHCSVAVVFSGHLPETGRGTFDDRCGRTVQHVLTNYQNLTGGGQGFLRTVEIDPLSLQAEFDVYSPILDQVRTGASERFSASLAPLVAVTGDASCDRSVSIADALLIAQYSVGNRVARTGCPLPDLTSELNVEAGDVNGDGSADIADALLIAQCSARLNNLLCPEG